MITRSQSKNIKPELEVEIDFDEASKAWNANKCKTGNGCYLYICGAELNNGKICRQIKCRRHKTI